MIGLLRYWFLAHWRSTDDLALELKALQAAMKRIQEWQRLTITEMRTAHSMLMAWRLAMESPEVDIRDEVDSLIRDYEDRIALLSEQVV